MGSLLPAGLSLNPNGMLSDTPTAGGSFSFTVVASNGITPNASQAVTLEIRQAKWMIALPLVIR